MEDRVFLGIYGALLAGISRHCGGGSSAFWGHIILYVMYKIPVAVGSLFVEMWKSGRGDRQPRRLRQGKAATIRCSAHAWEEKLLRAYTINALMQSAPSVIC